MTDLVEGATGLEAAERIARHDLARLNYPPANWVPERFGLEGDRVLDVLVVGAGMCGQTVGWNFLREGIRNIRVIERNGPRREGPWCSPVLLGFCKYCAPPRICPAPISACPPS